MGGAVVHRTAETLERRDGDREGLNEPSFRSILFGGLPGFFREGFLPLGAFYVGLRLSGLATGIALATLVSVLEYARERRVGRDGLLVRLSLAFVLVQSAVGLISDSTIVYLATPVVANGIWAAAFFGSVVLGRPLAGALASAWYPFSREFRETREFKRVFGVESIVWGVYLLARGGLRLAFLLHGGVGGFVVISFLTGTPMMLALIAWAIWYTMRRFEDDVRAAPEPETRAPVRTGRRRDRLAVWATRSLSYSLWRLGARLGIDVAGATEGPLYETDPRRCETFEALIADARAGDGTVDVAACPYPLHELLTHLVVTHGLLLHGSGNRSLEVLEPRPAHDWDTVLRAVVACDDGIWPIFYAVTARDRVVNIFSACLHSGRPPCQRRFYMFAMNHDPAATSSWRCGVVYAVRRTGFAREWGNEWVNAEAVRPVLRVPVDPDDFPLRDAVAELSSEQDFRRVTHHLRAAKRARAAATSAE
jgi:hypothetical protein